MSELLNGTEARLICAGSTLELETGWAQASASAARPLRREKEQLNPSAKN